MVFAINRRRIATHPRNPWEKDRLVKELKLMGEYGLRTKKELWTHLTVAKNDKKQARTLLISTDAKEVMVQGRALLNKLYKNGMIPSVDFTDENEIRKALKEVLNLELTHYLNRRLQYLVFTLGLAQDIQEAREMVTRRQITINGRVATTPSMIVRAENEGHIELNPFIKNRFASKDEEEPKEE